MYPPLLQSTPSRPLSSAIVPAAIEPALIEPSTLDLSANPSTRVPAVMVVNEVSASYPSRMVESQWIEALVDCPGAQGLYTYRVPPDLSIEPGDILSVPFGAQHVGAIAIRFVDHLPPELEPTSIRSVEEIISRGFFQKTYWDLLQRVAQYYYTPLMQVIRTALPPGLLGRSQRRIRLTPSARSSESSSDPSNHPSSATVPLQPAAQRILELLHAQKHGDYSWHYIQRQVRGASRGLRELMQRGWVESYLESPTPLRPKRQQVVSLANYPPPDDLSLQQRELVEILKRRGGEMGMQALLQTCKVSSSVLKTLVQKGCISLQQREILRLDQGISVSPDQPKVLTPDQANALNAILQLNGFAQVLLHGVTGSGKTEVYLQAIAPILQQGKSALVLVPEIGLTPQLTDRFRARFGNAVHVYHSALSAGERYDTWRQMLCPTPQIVIGTRSAIFAPLPQLGLIILDEEHDDSFKQDQPAPCYHARTVAQWRAEFANCPLILGSATPSLESWVLSQREEEFREMGGMEESLASAPFPESLFPSLSAPIPSISPVSASPVLTSPVSTSSSSALYLSLPQRVYDRAMPPIEVVDMRQELHHGNRSIFSRSLQTALREMAAQKQQGLLFIHRRGHSTFVSCRSCGHVMECPCCDVSLTYHQTQIGGYESLRCHYCGYGQSHPRQCPVCSSPYLKNFGSGTQRVMHELAQQFPELRCLRFDSDTTRTKGAHRALLTQFAQGEADILVGTQMLTKGIDLPQVTVVGIVAADGLLHLSDFRASERAFQTLTQVAGRAGRGDEPGRVVLQTYTPQHPVVQAVVKHDYSSFVATELSYRHALHYPPYGQLISLRLSGLEAEAVHRVAESIAQWLRSTLGEGIEAENYDVLGPAPATIARISRRYRWQILLKQRSNTPFNPSIWDTVRSLCPSNISLTIDVDPLHLL